MKKAAVVLNNWKLPTFQKYLDAAGVSYETSPSGNEGVSILKVLYKSTEDVQALMDAANKECATLAKSYTSICHGASKSYLLEFSGPLDVCVKDFGQWCADTGICWAHLLDQKNGGMVATYSELRGLQLVYG